MSKSHAKMRRLLRVPLTVMSVASCGFLLAGCSSANGASGKENELTGAARLAITAPTGVLSVQVTFTGQTRQVSRCLQVDGAAITLLQGLPTNTVQVSAAAYAGTACTGDAIWLADNQTVQLVPGQQTAIQLLFHPNGEAQIEGIFEADSTYPKLLGQIDTGNGGGYNQFDVDPKRNAVYVSNYNSTILKVDVANPSSMLVNTFYGGQSAGVAVDRATSRVGTTDIYAGHIIVFNSDGSLYDEQTIPGCGIAIAAGSHRFVASSQCQDWASVYDEDAKTVTPIVCFATGATAFYDSFNNHFVVQDGNGSCGAGGLDDWVLDIAPDNTYGHIHSVGSYTGIFLEGINASTGNMYFASGSSTVVAAVDYSVLATLPITGPLAADSRLNRFYVANASAASTAIRVFDGLTNTEINAGAFSLPDDYGVNSMLVAPGDERLYVLGSPSAGGPLRLFVYSTGS